MPTPEMRSDAKLSNFDLKSVSTSNDLNKTQETTAHDVHENSFPPKRITKFTSDGKPLES